MTPDDIRAVRFASVRKGGYEVREVDRFLADAMVALEAGDGRMTASDVHNARFTLVKRGGYNTQQVDQFLDELMETFEAGPTAAAPPPAPLAGSIAGSIAEATGVEPTGDVRVLETVPADPPDDQISVIDDEPEPEPEPEPAPPRPIITAAQLRRLEPPEVDGLAYDRAEVDTLIERVADSLSIFERVEGPGLQRLLASQYLQGSDGAPVVLAPAQVRAALFTVRNDGGYDTRGVDAAVRRLADALDHHWQRAE